MSTNSSKYYGENGIHRVPLWRIGGFALNNTATNLYLFMMNYVAYYLTGFVGVAVVTASSFSMMMRIWDGVTDPFIGFVVDKTNGKFGKNRPFMVIGNAILFVTSFFIPCDALITGKQGSPFCILYCSFCDLLHWIYVPVRGYQVGADMSDQRPEAETVILDF